jgi:hypothetical protein
MGWAESCSLVGLSVQPIAPTRDRGAGVVVDGGAPHGIGTGLSPVVTLRRRVAVATPDPALTARVAAVVVGAGHEVELATDSPFDAMLHRGELAGADDLLVLDPTRPGFEVALTNVLQAPPTVTADRRGRRAG